MGRGGESFISPAEQRAAIDAWALATGTTISEWHEDLDESGGSLDRPGLQLALDRCDRGETGGIVAAKLDRLTRSVRDLGVLLDRAEAGGWNAAEILWQPSRHSPHHCEPPAMIATDDPAVLLLRPRNSRSAGLPRKEHPGTS